MKRQQTDHGERPGVRPPANRAAARNLHLAIGAVALLIGAFQPGVGAVSAPVLTSILPNTAAPGSTVNVTLSGTGLQSPLSLYISGPGILVSNLTGNGSTIVTATFQIASSAS